MFNNLIWVEVNKENLINNIKELKKNIPKHTLFSAVVKSNAYGHGMNEVAKISVENGAHRLAVNSIDEAVELRQNNITVPILVMGYISLNDLHFAVQNDIDIIVYNIDTLKKLSELSEEYNKPVNIHLKLETGTNRQGISKNNLISFIDIINNSQYLFIAGLSTHFANIEDTTNHSYAKHQLNLYNEMTKLVKNNYKKKNNILCHTACSAAIILFKETYFDLVRAGISLYGLWPSKETYLSCILLHKQPVDLKPVLTWKTKVVQIKNVPAGQYVSYGCTFKTLRDSKLAVLPVGYYDGYFRSLSNKSYVIINDRRAYICGRICMNMIIVDITDIPGVQLENEVILIGKSKSENVSSEYLADLAGTINYEIVTNINRKIKRVIV